MTLAGYITFDEGALICDLAETYGIYDYESLPVKLVATLCAGLRENARIKLKMAEAKVNNELWLLAAAVDRLSLLVWQNTEAGRNGVDKPVMFTRLLMGYSEEHEKDILVFNTPEEFEKEMKKFEGREEGCQQ